MKVFPTTLKRYEKVYNFMCSKAFKKLDHFTTMRYYEVEARLERILTEMFFNRVLKNKIINYVQYQYAFAKPLEFDIYTFLGADDIYNELGIFEDKDLLDKLLQNVVNSTVKNIENHTLKLNF